MSLILVDSSVWISYFKDIHAHAPLTELIKKNQICTNDLILAELIPFLKIREEEQLIASLLAVMNIPLTINWEMIINYQILNIKNGINRVGIPDLILLDSVVTNNLILYSEDRHFKLMQEQFRFSLF